MRLGVRAGKGCEMLLDSKMQDLGCRYLQFDEVWGFIGKKERHVSVDDDPTYGEVLKMPPVVSPVTAVRAAIMQEYKLGTEES